MEHNSFTNEIRSIALQMSENEINQAINQLEKYKQDNYQKKFEDKSEYARLLTTTRKNISILHYHTDESETGQLTIYGVSLLSEKDYLKAAQLIPQTKYSWMLDECGLIVHNDLRRPFRWCSGVRMRPILFVLDMHETGLELGDSFFICDEEFVRISDYIAIKKECSKERYIPDDFREFRTRMKQIIGKWYGQLKKTIDNKSNSATKMVHCDG